MTTDSLASSSGPLLDSLSDPGTDASLRRSDRPSKHNRGPRSSRRRSRTDRSRKPSIPPEGWAPDEHDGRRLAADPSIVLPGERTPRLKRQEAFRAPKTHESYYAARYLAFPCAYALPASDLDCAIAVDDDELYRLGLLYEDDGVRGAGFSLDLISHTEPYLVRPARRAARRQQRRPRGAQRRTQGEADRDFSQLRLYLSAAVQGPGGAQPLATIPELPEWDGADVPGLVSDSEKGGDVWEEDYDWAFDMALSGDADVLSLPDTENDLDVDFVDVTSGGTGEEAWIGLGDGS
ncbi:hypothetical protein GGS23DRAFT_590174 [Durotheca rogersii]|uniref:uncharacterized protein n=1 Tax=Durotheca rogersii TaxID=419775 RepID=UPI00221EDADB|nr:uncharacterized protein GGS23DRAFT_590174 [Durotheca rogersii]KAI5855106.1 hypothetical protein GGS23DRAFT_590174 [Durotheca rogersii]